MTGHAFQVLLDDESTLSALTVFHRHLAADGLLAFEIRNPSAREWDGWVADRSRTRIRAPDGEPFEVWVDETTEMEPDLVSFTWFTRSLSSGEQRTSHSTLRFADPNWLRQLLARAGFSPEGWFGDWDRSPVGPTSPEVIVLARPSGRAVGQRRAEVIVAGAIDRSRGRFERAGPFDSADVIRHERDRR